jgi:hypothetical protein
MTAGCTSPADRLSAPRSTTTSVGPTSSVPPPPVATTTTVPPSVPTCTAEQLDIQFQGTQGSTGNYFAAFWIADISATACALRSEVDVLLLDSRGIARRSATFLISAPLPLSARAVMPPVGADPENGQQLSFISLQWPTVFNSGLPMAPGATQCPQPAFTPTSVRFEFGVDSVIIVRNLLGPNGPIGSLCGPDFRIFDVGSL